MFIRDRKITHESYTQNETDAEALNLLNKRVIMSTNK